MPQTVNTNLYSLNAQRSLNASQAQLSVAMARLSSGLRVNGAKDDAAGLAIAERMTAQVRGMNVAIRNANDGISMMQVAESAMGSVSNILQRLRELAVQSANSTNSDGDRKSLNEEFLQLKTEAVRILDGTTFNGLDVFKYKTGLTFQIGPNTTESDTMSLPPTSWWQQLEVRSGVITDLGSTKLHQLLRDDTPRNSDLSLGYQLSSQRETAEVIDAIDAAIDQANMHRAQLGAFQSRFESVISNLQVAVENQMAARGRIMDADFAMETASLSRAQILQQAGSAMLASANQIPQQVLALLK